MPSKKEKSASSVLNDLTAAIFWVRVSPWHAPFLDIRNLRNNCRTHFSPQVARQVMSFFNIFGTRLSQCALASKVNVRCIVLLIIVSLPVLVVNYKYSVFTTTVTGIQVNLLLGNSSRHYHFGVGSTEFFSPMQTSLLMNSLNSTYNVSDTTPTVHDQQTQSGDVVEVRVATLMENVSSNGEADVENDHDSQSVLVCPMNKPFLVYVCDTPGNSGLQNSEVMASLIKDLQLGNSWTDNPVSACIFVLVIGPWSEAVSPEDINSLIHSLPHWQTNSNRHVLVELSPSNSKSRPFSVQVKTGAALVATSYFSTQHTNYTLIPPLLTNSEYHNILPPTDALIAKTRKTFLYFEGEMDNYESNGSGLTVVNICNEFPKSLCSLKCSVRREEGALDNEWSLCNNAADRLGSCQQAVFALVPCGSEGEVGPASFTRLLEALQCGAVPVVVGNCDNGQLPFGEVIEWKDLAIFTPSKELFTKLTLKNQTNLRKYRQRGLFIFNNYFSSELRIVESLIAIVRSHSNHPPMWYPDYIPDVLVNTMPRIAVAPIVRNITKYEYSESVWNTSPGPFYSQNSHPANQPFSERFTIVILTYHRETSLIKLVEKLKNCPFLDKVVIVWNNEQNIKHPKQYKWPDIGIPIEVNMQIMNTHTTCSIF